MFLQLYLYIFCKDIAQLAPYLELCAVLCSVFSIGTLSVLLRLSIWDCVLNDLL